jgi:trehalose 6-phosphate synthase/phosphatase
MPARPDVGRREGAPTAERLIVVSLRLPLTVRRASGSWQAQPSAGGLVSALGPLADRLDAQWIGWAGEPGGTDDAGRREVLAAWQRDHGYVAVDLEPALARTFYDGYSNATLWPLLHGFPGRIEFDHRTWLGYREANERFAGAVVERHRPGDLVWINDYQLALVPGLVRARIPDARIGFFLHVPFPASEIFRILPDRAALLQGILGADLIGFQTHGDLHDFRRAVQAVLGLSSHLDRVDVDDRPVALAALPVGIVVADWDRRLASRRVISRIRERATASDGRRTILAVDRLDYTKGIPERLLAYRELLRRRPELRRRIQLLQVAVPSRERVPRYAELRRTVSELVGDINGEVGAPDWTPVVYLRRTIPADELAALYATADVAWVSPLRDGMNLVAKEYVACQADRAGVLVVSEFAGAAQELGEAIRVNPYDLDGSVEAIERALALPEEERRARQAAMLGRVRRNDAVAWSERFLAALRAAAEDRAAHGEADVGAPPAGRISAAYRAAGRRAFYLDYDGSLVPIAARPADAVPTPEALAVLARLTADPANQVVLMSGRPRDELEAWFGQVAGLWLVAEHGALLRAPGARRWRPLHPAADARWKAGVRPLLERAVDQAPGSFIEEKRFGLAWHYRLAEPEFGTFLAAEVAGLLELQLGGTDLTVLRGRKIVEVRYAWANKGEAATSIRSAGAAPGFELALGDDRTDEDLFERLPPAAWTIRVGDGPSRARFRVASPAAAVSLLDALAGPRLGPSGTDPAPTKASHGSSRPRTGPRRAAARPRPRDPRRAPQPAAR